MPTDLERWKSSWERMTKENAFGAVLSMTREYTEDEFRQSGKNNWATISQHLPADCNRIVDIGCGAGRVLEFARQNCTEAVGIDISQEMLRLAEERLGNDGFIFTDGFDSIEAGSIDFIYTVGVFKHLTIEMVANHIENGAEALRKGGIFYINYYAKQIPGKFNNWIDETADDKDVQHPRSNRIIPEERMLAILAANRLKPKISTDFLVVAERE